MPAVSDGALVVLEAAAADAGRCVRRKLSVVSGSGVSGRNSVNSSSLVLAEKPRSSSGRIPGLSSMQRICWKPDFKFLYLTEARRPEKQFENTISESDVRYPVAVLVISAKR